MQTDYNFTFAHRFMNHLYSIAFTHKNTPLNVLGKLHIAPDSIEERLAVTKQLAPVGGLMFLSTCNRSEFVVSSNEIIDANFIESFIRKIYPNFTEEEINQLVKSYQFNDDYNAVKHLMEVASSLDSMLIGEREIITQFRKAYEVCKDANLTDDVIRIAVQACIETAKEVYTDTRIAHKQVSVVALAFEQLKDSGLTENNRVVMIGAGQTNATMAKFLQKFGCTDVHIFNRSLDNVQQLSKDVNATAHSLQDLYTYTNGFDVLIYCTAAEESFVTPEVYSKLLHGETGRKIVVDLSIPNGISDATLAKNNIHYINIEALQAIANINIQFRLHELESCNAIIQNNIEKFSKTVATRRVEIAMQQVPEKIRHIKNTALNNVFAKDVEKLDENSKEILEKIFDYMEKRYIAEPMKIAKEILLQQI